MCERDSQKTAGPTNSWNLAAFLEVGQPKNVNKNAVTAFTFKQFKSEEGWRDAAA